ncbi:MAG: NAD(P)/FAD-dependent oxidoreductase [Bryobacterales bacterium]|nr:NAD(P)/FAD-dependent oxidoreductase [Bryobacterales bacterium]
MRSVAVIGGGPAGAMVAECLSRQGFQVRLLDEKLAWEKPCGGGVTQKAYLQFPFLSDLSKPHAAIARCQLRADEAKPYQVSLQHPVLIYSRKELNQLLLDRATSAGVHLEQTRVTSVERSGAGWRLQCKKSSLEADYLILATGARNPFRRLGTEWDSSNAMLAIGYYLPVASSQIDLQFFSWLQGYLWLFPRGDHISAGICGKGASHGQMRAALERYLDDRGIAWEGAAFFAHLIPALETRHWQQNRVAGDGWLAVGDAAGLVDPLTGEGIYYAMRSGELAAQAVVGSRTRSDDASLEAHYTKLLRDDFVEELELAAKLARVFYLGETGLGTVPQRMIQFARHNSRIRQLLQDLVSGAQNYSGLRSRVSESLHARVLSTILKYLRGSYARLESAANDDHPQLPPDEAAELR